MKFVGPTNLNKRQISDIWPKKANMAILARACFAHWRVANILNRGHLVRVKILFIKTSFRKYLPSSEIIK